ncbi:reverse transcriptase domain-containing protein [Prolixibacteraceae bacterium Z1-6]|uniref:Reverse transcriptase domain-containing protein n=1 Tax=Draconibacterium aestuarii TaxID=2998507 RepID=A0A9X3FAB8_9BACT|nr:reverse transcriptase domain-containing protein [Prolixibacteraceae bacterium Z1-6]
MKTNETLLDLLSSNNFLYDAWNQLKKEDETSHGLSGITIEQFKKDLNNNIDNISKSLKNKTYRFSPTRAAIIKKDNGKYRPLQIPEIADRVVLKAISCLLSNELQIFLQKSEDISFAYQKGKGVREAVLKMKSTYKKGDVILKADIINFFEEVKKDDLLNKQIFPNLKDDSINKLIKNSISQKLGGLRRIKREYRVLFKNAKSGIPQGNPLSPLLSNIYLSDFDLYIKNQGYTIIRYADDFIVIFNSEKEAKEGYKKIRIYLNEKFSLNIHPLDSKNDKTKIINPEKSEISFLSIKFDGINIYPSKDTIGILKNRIRKIIKTGELNSQLFTDIYKEIKKWIAIYSYLDIDRYFSDIDNYLISQLNKTFGQKKYKTTKCNKLAHNVRNKQFEKSSKSFWRNQELKNILPNFIRRKKLQQTQLV